MELEELIEVVQKLSAQVAELRLENANLNAELNKSRVTRVRSSASKVHALEIYVSLSCNW